VAVDFKLAQVNCKSFIEYENFVHKNNFEVNTSGDVRVCIQFADNEHNPHTIVNKIEAEPKLSFLRINGGYKYLLPS